MTIETMASIINEYTGTTGDELMHETFMLSAVLAHCFGQTEAATHFEGRAAEMKERCAGNMPLLRPGQSPAFCQGAPSPGWNFGYGCNGRIE